MNFQQIILQQIKDRLRRQDMVLWLIAVNIALFLLFILIQGIAFLFGYNNIVRHFVETWLYLPSTFNSFIIQFYTIISYQFLHANAWHLFSNSIILYYFGNVFIQLKHKKKLLPLYLWGGFMGAIFFLLAYNLNATLITQSVQLVGASGAAMAIVAAVATLIPNREVYLFGQWKIKMQWIAFFFLVMNLIQLSGTNIAGALAHLGGLFAGYIFVKLYQEKGIDVLQPISQTINYMSSFFLTPELEVTYVNEKFKGKKQYRSTKTTNAQEKENKEKVDAILDKIKDSGYEKLSKAEKNFLFRQSKK